MSLENALMESAPIGRWQIYLARSRAWTSLLVLAPVAVMAVLSAPHFAFDNFADCAVELVAWLLFLAGAMTRWWATLFIGGRKGQELITQGPYSICRNPLYLGSMLLAFSVAAFLQSATLAAALCIVACGYLNITVPVEERKLAELHGEAFRDYCRRVPRFFPNFALHSAPRELSVRLDGMRCEARRMLQWAIIPIVCYSIQHLRMLPDWPHYYTLP